MDKIYVDSLYFAISMISDIQMGVKEDGYYLFFNIYYPGSTSTDKGSTTIMTLTECAKYLLLLKDLTEEL